MSLVAAIEWNVRPEIFQIGPVALRWYSVLFLAGFLVGQAILRRIFLREGKDASSLDNLLLVMLAGTLVGARLGHCFFYNPAEYLAEPWRILMVWKGGLASHGGLVGNLVALWLWCRRHPDQPYLWLIDRLTISAALAGALIRLGNLFNSEILGKPVAGELPWAVVFLRGDRSAVPRHPVMIYESLSYLAICAILWLLYRRTGAATPRGRLLGLFLTLVFGARFVWEFFKERQTDASLDWALSMGQLLSLPAIAAGLVLIVAARPVPPPPRPDR